MTAMAHPLPPPPWVPADPAALRQALAEAKAAGKLPGPGFVDYLVDLARWVGERLQALLERALPWTGMPIVERVAIYTALAGALLAALAVLLVALRRWRSARRREAAAAATPGTSPPPAPSGDAAWWLAELQRRLAEGRLRPALEAAWWWTARRLDPPGLDASWTSGELLRATGAAALRSPLRRLDRQLWGGSRPRLDEVEAVVAELGGAAP